MPLDIRKTDGIESHTFFNGHGAWSDLRNWRRKWIVLFKHSWVFRSEDKWLDRYDVNDKAESKCLCGCGIYVVRETVLNATIWRQKSGAGEKMGFRIHPLTQEVLLHRLICFFHSQIASLNMARDHISCCVLSEFSDCSRRIRFESKPAGFCRDLRRRGGRMELYAAIE